jgi:hypothetical protein
LNSDKLKIPVRLTRAEVGLIWKGLNHIACAYAHRESTGEEVYGYPSKIFPLAKGADRGSFSPAMMNRVLQVHAKLNPKKTTGGTIQLDSFELRALAFSARLTLQIQRDLAHKTRKTSLRETTEAGVDPKSIRKLKQAIGKTIKFLEVVMKRAKRLFVSQRSNQNFKEESAEWRAHLRWMQLHLAFFKRIRVGSPNTRRMQRKNIDQLVSMAKKEIAAVGYEMPEDKRIRNAVRLFISECRRGRVGYRHYRYLLNRRDEPDARSELLLHLAPRLGFNGGGMRQNRGKATRAEHKRAAKNPETKRKIEELRDNFKENWSQDERREHMNTLLTVPGISIRGLADDTGIPESTLRSYVDPNLSTRGARSTAERAKAPLVPGKPATSTTPSQPVTVQKKVSKKLVSPSRNLKLPPRPEPREAQIRRFANLLIDFYQARGTPLGFKYPSEINNVLYYLQSFLEQPAQTDKEPGPFPETEEERMRFFGATNMGAVGDDLCKRLAFGTRDIFWRLTKDERIWKGTVNELDKICKEANQQRDSEQNSKRTAQPGFRVAQISQVRGGRWTPQGR